MDINATPSSEVAQVLVVDDEGANRYSVSKTLQRVGYTVNEAASGEEALEQLQKQNYDVILTDIRMPGIDGVELLRRIKEEAPDAIVICAPEGNVKTSLLSPRVIAVLVAGLILFTFISLIYFSFLFIRFKCFSTSEHYKYILFIYTY